MITNRRLLLFITAQTAPALVSDYRYFCLKTRGYYGILTEKPIFCSISLDFRPESEYTAIVALEGAKARESGKAYRMRIY